MQIVMRRLARALPVGNLSVLQSEVAAEIVMAARCTA
jgi:hypothetical protein